MGTHPAKTRYVFWLVTIVLVAAGAALIFRFVSPPPGEESGVAISDAGQFTGAKYRGMRESHAKNQKLYAQLSFVSMSSTSSLTAQLSNIIKRKLDSDEYRAMALPPEALQALPAFLGRTIASRQSLSFDEYLQGLPPQLIAKEPTPSGMITDFYSFWMSDASPPQPLSDPSALKRAAREMFEKEQNHRGGGARLESWVPDDSGFAVALQWLKPEKPATDLLIDRLPEADLAFWYGQMAQGALVIFQPPTSWQDKLKRQGRLLWAHVIMIVRTRDGDMFPLHIECWFDPETSQWHLYHASRRSSVRAGNSPPMIF